MGCDIHLHTEVKIDGKWQHYSVCYIRRNYRWFARLANVRAYPDDPIEPIDEPRGIPYDATELTTYDVARWGEDGHSHSWINAQEIHDFKAWAEAHTYPGQKLDAFWFEDSFGYLFGNGWDGFMKYPEDNPKDLEDIRFIFWFDN